MRASSPPSKSRFRAFTLIEMLVVVTIVVLLLAFATPALTRTLQASRLSAAGESIMGSLAEAQQLALTTNVPVDIRFFSYQSGFDPAPVFHSYQLFKITQSRQGSGGSATVMESAVPVGNLINLPEGIIIPTDSTVSAALSSTGIADKKDNSDAGYSGVSGATYNAVRFMPDGTCRTVGNTTNGFAQLTFQTLPNSYFTVTFDIGAAVTAANLPKNFYTIQIDPFTGKARNYKPGF